MEQRLQRRLVARAERALELGEPMRGACLDVVVRSDAVFRLVEHGAIRFRGPGEPMRFAVALREAATYRPTA